MICVVRNVILRSVLDVCDVCSFSAYVCETGPFLGGVGGYGFVGVGDGGFVWFYWEGIIVEDVVYYV